MEGPVKLGTEYRLILVFVLKTENLSVRSHFGRLLRVLYSCERQITEKE